MTHQTVKPIKLTAKQIRQIERATDFEFAKKLLKEFPAANIYVVGGTARDAIMGRTDTKDYDIVITGMPAKKLAAHLGKYGIVNLVGRNFGVYKFLPTGADFKNPIDVSLPRREFALGTGGYRDFDIQSDPNLPIEADLARRDFTWNAMAYDIKNKKLIDPWSGIFDLKKQIIRAVGNPAERFAEDYSRMLRAIRFAVKFGFEIEKETLGVIKKLLPRINDERVINNKKERITPYEIISAEFLKTLAAEPAATIKLYEKIGALKIIFPEIIKMKKCAQPKEYHAEGDVLAHTLLALNGLKNKKILKIIDAEKAGLELIVATLFHDLGKPIKRKIITEKGEKRVVFYAHDEAGANAFRQLADRIKLSASPDMPLKTERVEWLIRNHLITFNNDPYRMRETTLEKYFFNPKYSGDDLLALSLADALATFPNGKKADLRNLNRFLKKIKEMKKMAVGKKILPPPPLNGNAIMKLLKLKPGPKVGEIISLLREEQLSGRVKNRQEAEKYIKHLAI